MVYYYDPGREDFTAQNPNTKSETYLYHILPLKHFLKMISDRQLHMHQVIKWEDPCEGILLKQKLFNGDKEISLDEKTEKFKNFYGQCWCSDRDSDAMWKIYSSDQMGIRIKTTDKRIIECLTKVDNIGDIYVGNIKYLSSKQFPQWIKDQDDKDILSVENVRKSLFIKKQGFSHEKEFRILINSQRTPKDDGINVDINPRDFIIEVSVDPRLDERTSNFLMNALRLYLGPTYTVSQSTLLKTQIKKLHIKQQN